MMHYVRVTSLAGQTEAPRTEVECISGGGSEDDDSGQYPL
jgi:hypothetical protein